MIEEISYPHVSITDGETSIQLSKCVSDSCGCRWVHCPLCAPGRIGVGTRTFMQKHFYKIHEQPAVSYKGLKLFVCLLKCAAQKHYHCPKCGQVIPKATKTRSGIKEHLTVCKGIHTKSLLYHEEKEKMDLKESPADKESQNSESNKIDLKSFSTNKESQDEVEVTGSVSSTVMFSHVSILHKYDKLRINAVEQDGQKMYVCSLCGATIKPSQIERHRGQHMLSQIKWADYQMLGCSLDSCILTLSMRRRSRYQLHFHCPWCADILTDRRSAIAHYSSKHVDQSQGYSPRKSPSLSEDTRTTTTKHHKTNNIRENEHMQTDWMEVEVFDEVTAVVNNDALSHIGLPSEQLHKKLQKETGVSCDIHAAGLSLIGSWKQLQEARQLIRKLCTTEGKTTQRIPAMETTNSVQRQESIKQVETGDTPKNHKTDHLMVATKKSMKLGRTMTADGNCIRKKSRGRPPKRKMNFLFKGRDKSNNRDKSSDFSIPEVVFGSQSLEKNVSTKIEVERQIVNSDASAVQSTGCDMQSGDLSRKCDLTNTEAGTALVSHDSCIIQTVDSSPVAAAEHDSGDVPFDGSTVQSLTLKDDEKLPNTSKDPPVTELEIKEALVDRDVCQDIDSVTSHSEIGTKQTDTLCRDGETNPELLSLEMDNRTRHMKVKQEGSGCEQCPICFSSLPIRQLVKHVITAKNCKASLEDIKHEQDDQFSPKVKRLISGLRNITNCTCPVCGVKRNCMSQVLYHYVVGACNDVGENSRRNVEFFRQHGVIHDPVSKLYKCSHCNIQARKPIHLRNHIEAVHLPKIYSCQHCPRRFSTKEKKEHHMRVHVDLVKCPHCDKSFMQSYLPQHVAKIHQELDIKCTLCDFVTKSNIYLRRHMENRHSSGHHLCEWCGKHFGQKTTMLRHVNAVHLGIKYKRKNPAKLGKATCNICGLTMLKKNLNTHIQRRHQGLKLFACDVCGASFTSKHSAKVHKLKHMSDEERSEAQKYVCELCGQRFYKKYLQQEHIKAHKALYDCQKCGKHFRYRHSLIQHQKRPGVCRLSGVGELVKCNVSSKAQDAESQLMSTRQVDVKSQPADAGQETYSFTCDVKQEQQVTTAKLQPDVTKYIVQEVEEVGPNIQGAVVEQILAEVTDSQDQAMSLIWSKSNNELQNSHIVTEAGQLVAGSNRLVNESLVNDVTQLVKMEDSSTVYETDLTTQTFAMIQGGEGTEYQTDNIELQPGEEFIMIDGTNAGTPYCLQEESVQYQCGHCHMLFVSMEEVNDHVNLSHV